MEMTIRKLLTLFLFLGLVSCSENRVFEEFKEVPNQSWSITDSITFDLPVVDLSAKTTLLGIRYNDTYTFTNFYVKLLSKDSLGVVLEEKLVNMVVFDPKSGKPLGKGFGNTFTYYDTLDFTFPATVQKVTLLQYMRENQLDGIEAVGLKILN